MSSLSPALGPMPAASAAILALARRHGVQISGEIAVNDVGLDFRIASAVDASGVSWVLRIPRRADVLPKIGWEAQVLRFLASRLSVAVPDWRVVSDELIAYPRLMDRTALCFDAETQAVTWHIAARSPVYTESLAATLVALHAIPVEDAVAAGFAGSTPESVRRAHAEQLDTVRRSLGVSAALAATLTAWLDDDTSWPSVSALVHGDLYAGHTLVDSSGRVSGIIDWTEAGLSDPSIDFTGHFLAFGEAGLSDLLDLYARLGGHTWPTMARHIRARSAFSPVRYGVFALGTGDDGHLAAARAQLGA